MRYYSEEIVRKIYENALIVGIDDAISKAKSIELPDKYGRLIDADEVKKKKKHSYKEFCENVVSVYDIDNAPTVLEAST